MIYHEFTKKLSVNRKPYTKRNQTKTKKAI